MRIGGTLLLRLAQTRCSRGLALKYSICGGVKLKQPKKKMCLYPKLITNRKYVSNKKNGGVIPELKDKRALMVPVGCGKCMECKKQKARAWSIRLQEEIKEWKQNEKQFVTLTFSNESIYELTQEIKGLTGYELDNEIATLGVRRFLERWRKKYKKSIKHWLITELGHNGTENIHLHGIIFTKEVEDIKTIWKYGFVYIGDYVNETTVNYCVKYATKTDIKHAEYNAKVLTSPGMGNKYTTTSNAERNKYKGTETKEYYQTREGQRLNLPVYWKNKIYTDEEREQLWLNKLDKLERWVDGTKIDISKGDEQYIKSLKQARAKNRRLGYQDDRINWERIKYENQLREINNKKRIEKHLENENK